VPVPKTPRAAPFTDKPEHPKTAEGKPFGWKRQKLFAAGDSKLFEFIYKELLLHLHSLAASTAKDTP